MTEPTQEEIDKVREICANRVREAIEEVRQITTPKMLEILKEVPESLQEGAVMTFMSCVTADLGALTLSIDGKISMETKLRALIDAIVIRYGDIQKAYQELENYDLQDFVKTFVDKHKAK